MMQVTVVGGDIIMLIASATTAKWKATKEVHSLASPHLHEYTHARTHACTHTLTHSLSHTRTPGNSGDCDVILCC